MGLVIRNATLFDGTGAPPIPNVEVTLSNDRIARVGAPREGPAREGTVVDAGGRFLMPGLINLHSHMFRRVRPEDPPGRNVSDVVMIARGVNNARDALLSGVTTSRDVGARDYLDVQLRDAIKRRTIEGPRLFVCGRPITKTGGHNWEFSREADGPDEARKAVREQVKAWADVIKIMASGGGREGFEAGVFGGGASDEEDPHQVVEAILARASDTVHYVEYGHTGFTVEEVQAIVDEAHLAGRRVAAHASVLGGVKVALRGGVDTVEHGIFLDEEAIDLFHKKKAWLVPTISTSFNRILEGRERGWSPAVNQWARSVAEPWFASLRRAIRGQVPIATGTDAGGDMVLEVELFVRAGMSAADALRAATLNAAQALGMEAELGTVQAGRVADLVLVEGSPLDRIEDLRRVSLVVKDGRVVLDRLQKGHVAVNV